MGSFDLNQQVTYQKTLESHSELGLSLTIVLLIEQLVDLLVVDEEIHALLCKVLCVPRQVLYKCNKLLLLLFR